jgi:hypothetical protein
MKRFFGQIPCRSEFEPAFPKGWIVANNSTGLRHLAHREARFNLVVTSTCFCQPVSFCALKARMSASRLKRPSGKRLRCI